MTSLSRSLTVLGMDGTREGGGNDDDNNNNNESYIYLSFVEGCVVTLYLLGEKRTQDVASFS